MSTPDAIPLVTDEELAEYGFIPGNIIGSPRLKSWPVKLRHNDDLIERSESGALSAHIGFFSPEQIRTREIIGQIMRKKFKDGFFDSPLFRDQDGAY